MKECSDCGKTPTKEYLLRPPAPDWNLTIDLCAECVKNYKVYPPKKV